MQKIAVYSPIKSPRLTYILSFLSERFGITITPYHDEKLFNDTEGAKINYSGKSLDGFAIEPHGILFENDIKKFDYDSLKSDPFSWMFFLLSRYEEYVSTKRDQHGRFQGKDSYLYSIGLLQSPVVDKEIKKLKNDLILKYPFLQFKKVEFSKQLTIDIDQAYAYKNKSLKRFVGSNLRDLSQLKFTDIFERTRVFIGNKKDPYDVYEKIQSRFNNKNSSPIFFFQIGNYGAFDKNLNFKNKGFLKVIRSTRKWAQVGLHPSYASNTSIETLKLEKDRLENVLDESVTQARQHYIKLHLPQTYQNYTQLNISHDYSMGFADEIGFRAGTSRSFLWYDLENEKSTNLRIHPFCVMDVTLRNYMELSLEEARNNVEHMQNSLRSVDGKFCIIVHNESLSDYKDWKGWSDLFLQWFT